MEIKNTNKNKTVGDIIKDLQNYDPNLPIVGNVQLKKGDNFVYGSGEVWTDFDIENPECVVMFISGNITCN